MKTMEYYCQTRGVQKRYLSIQQEQQENDQQQNGIEYVILFCVNRMGAFFQQDVTLRKIRGR